MLYNDSAALIHKVNLTQFIQVKWFWYNNYVL